MNVYDDEYDVVNIIGKGRRRVFRNGIIKRLGKVCICI